MIEYRIPQGKMKNHYPLGLVSKHCAAVGIQWPYPHQHLQEELMHKGIDTLADTFKKGEASTTKGVWDSTKSIHEQKWTETEPNKTLLHIVEEKIVT